MKRRVRASDVVVVFVTCPTLSTARRLARHLVTRRLAACVNIIPRIESTFFWNGKIERTPETLLVIKTTLARMATLRRTVVELHPYDTPEVLALPVRTGHQPYLRWVLASTSPRDLAQRRL